MSGQVIGYRKLAKLIKQEGSTATIAQNLETLQLLDKVIQQQIEQGNKVNIGFMLQLHGENVQPKKHWDGINKKYVTTKLKSKIFIKKKKILRDLEKREIKG